MHVQHSVAWQPRLCSSRTSMRPITTMAMPRRVCLGPRPGSMPLLVPYQSQHTRQHRPHVMARCSDGECDDTDADSDDDEEGCAEYELHHLVFPSGRQPLRAASLGRDYNWIVATELDAAWSRNVPDGLLKALNERTSHGELQYVTYDTTPLETGFANETWFVRYQDGTCQWGTDLPGPLRKVLKEHDQKTVQAVYLGPADAYLVTFTDCKLLHRNLPSGMTSAVHQADKEHGGLENVAMGPSGEWFVRAKNGTIWMCAAHDSLDQLLDNNELYKPERVYFGWNYTYIAVFHDRLVWRVYSTCDSTKFTYQLTRAALSDASKKEQVKAAVELTEVISKHGISERAAEELRNVLLQLSDGM